MCASSPPCTPPQAASRSCHPVGDLSGSNVCAHCFLSCLLHAREIRWVRTKGGTSLCAWGLPHLPIRLRGGHARQRGGLQREICPPAHHSLAPLSSVCPSCVVGAAAVCECAWPQCWFFTNALAARSAVGCCARRQRPCLSDEPLRPHATTDER